MEGPVPYITFQLKTEDSTAECCTNGGRTSTYSQVQNMDLTNNLQKLHKFNSYANADVMNLSTRDLPNLINQCYFNGNILKNE